MLHEELNKRTSVGAECLGQIRERVIVDGGRDKRVNLRVYVRRKGGIEEIQLRIKGAGRIELGISRVCRQHVRERVGEGVASGQARISVCVEQTNQSS